VRPISEAEAQAYLGNLLARTNRLDEAEVLLKQASAAEPDLPRPYEGLGLVAMRRNRFDEAMENFKQAATRGSKNQLAHYYYAEALQRQAVGNITPDVAKKISEELKTSIKLMPGFAHSYYALAFLHFTTGENLKEGTELMRTAMRLEPQNRHFALSLAQLQVRMQDYGAAKKTLEPLLASDSDPALRTSAESMIKMIEYYTRAPKEADRVAEPEPPPSSPPAEKAAPRLMRRPTLKVEGAETIRGVLVSIECERGKWVLVVQKSNDILRFAVGDKDKLEVYSQDPSFEGSVNCGPVNKIAYIYYKPMPGQSKFAGDAVAVEFTRN